MGSPRNPTSKKHRPRPSAAEAVRALVAKQGPLTPGERAHADRMVDLFSQVVWTRHALTEQAFHADVAANGPARDGAVTKKTEDAKRSLDQFYAGLAVCLDKLSGHDFLRALMKPYSDRTTAMLVRQVESLLRDRVTSLRKHSDGAEKAFRGELDRRLGLATDSMLVEILSDGEASDPSTDHLAALVRQALEPIREPNVLNLRAAPRRSGTWFEVRSDEPIDLALAREIERRLSYRLCRWAKLPERGWHILRHAFATHAARFGVNPWKLMMWLGHKRIDETMLYVDLANLKPRPIPESILEAGAEEKDPDRRVIKMLGSRANSVPTEPVAREA